jgi:hypothetical protein
LVDVDGIRGVDDDDLGGLGDNDGDDDEIAEGYGSVRGLGDAQGVVGSGLWERAMRPISCLVRGVYRVSDLLVPEDVAIRMARGFPSRFAVTCCSFFFPWSYPIFSPLDSLYMISLIIYHRSGLSFSFSFLVTLESHGQSHGV